MTELRSVDLRGALELVHRIGGACDRAAFRSLLLQELRSLLPAESAVHHEYDWRDGGNAIVEDPVGFHGRAVIEEAPERLMSDHPIARYVAESADPGAVRLSDVSSQRRWHRNPIYDFAFRPHGLEHQLGVVLHVLDSTTAALALNRSRPDFAERECQLVDLLRPHIEQAFENAALREMVAAAGDGAGVVLISALGRVESVTPRAQRLLATHLNAMVAAGSRLPEPIASWLSAQLSRTGDAERPLVCLPLRLETARGELHVRLASESLLVLEESESQIDGAALATHSLTRREIEVLRLVARGLMNEAIASELAISPRTVQKHLERIHAKLGVAGRTAAVARAMELSRVRDIAY